MFDIIFKLFQWIPREHALGKVDELLEKVHWWMTGEIDRDEERREKNFQTNIKRRGRNFTAASFMLYCSFFILAQRKLLSGENEGFLCYCFFSLPLPPKWTVLFLVFFFPLSWVGWGFLTIPWLCLFHHFFHIIPLWAPFLFSFALFFRARGWPGHTSTAGQPISSPTFISLSCLMLKNFHTRELCQIA